MWHCARLRRRRASPRAARGPARRRRPGRRRGTAPPAKARAPLPAPAAGRRRHRHPRRQICPTSTSRMASGPMPSRAACEMLGIRRRTVAADRPPAELHGAEPLPRAARPPASVCLRRVAEQLRGIGRLGASCDRSPAVARPARRGRGRADPTAPSRRPTRCAAPAADPCCRIRLAPPCAAMSAGAVESAAPARRRRTGRQTPCDIGQYEGGDRGQRRGFALAPADMPAGRDPHQQRILAAICLGRYLWHRQVEQVDRVNFHPNRPSASGSGPRMAGQKSAGTNASNQRGGGDFGI